MLLDHTPLSFSSAYPSVLTIHWFSFSLLAVSVSCVSCALSVALFPSCFHYWPPSLLAAGFDIWHTMFFSSKTAGQALLLTRRRLLIVGSIWESLLCRQHCMLMEAMHYYCKHGCSGAALMHYTVEQKLSDKRYLNGESTGTTFKQRVVFVGCITLSSNPDVAVDFNF